MPVDETHVEATVRAFQQMRDDNARLNNETRRLEHVNALQAAEIDSLKSQVQSAELQRDHYMRFSTELVVKMATVRMVMEDAERTARRHAYNPAKQLADEAETLKQLEQAVNSEPAT